MQTTSSRSVRAESIHRGRAAERRPGRARRARLFRHELRTLLAVAGPIIISQLGTVGMTTVDTLMVGPLGATALAAAAVGAAIHTTVLMVCTGVVLGMTPLVSQAFGAGDRGRCRRVLVQGLWLALALSIPLAVISLAGGPLARLLGQDPGVAGLAGGYMVALGASLAGSIRVGHHIGARNRHGVRRAVMGTYFLTLGFMGCCALAFVAAPEALIGLYTDDPAIVRLGAALLLLAAFFQLFDGGQVAGISLLRGATDTRVPMLMAALGYWGVGLPVAYGLGFHTPLGPRGIWVGLALSLGVVAVLMGRRVRRVLW